VLTGPIYGQRAASLKFFETLRDWLVRDMGFVQGENEPCVFVKPGGFAKGDGSDLTVATWVDDCICRGGRADTDHFYAEMAKRFELKDPSFLTPEAS
jgi:hypothetical protein